MKRPYQLLLHPAFIISLFILLLNDISLKYEFHNAVTGKLSDFCGLFVFALFWMVLFPRYRNIVAVVMAVLFCWWKSPFSSSFIEQWNDHVALQLSRVVDYTDLAALCILPFAAKLSSLNYDVRIKYKRLFIPVVGCVCIFSFCFTSAVRYAAYYYSPNEIRFYGSFDSKKTEQEILDKLTQQHIGYQRDSIAYYPATNRYETGEYVRQVKDPQTGNVSWVSVAKLNDSSLYVRRKEDPFYLIPNYSINGHVINNVKFTINPGKKGNIVHVQTFQWDSKTEFTGTIKRQYKKHFRELFK